MPIFIVAVTIFAALYILYFVRARNTGPRLPLPPGPPGDWDITSLSSFSSLETLESLFEEYGPVFTLRSGSKLAVMIGRQQAAVDIMEKEGAALADRPRWTAASEMVSGGMRLLLLQSGERLRKFRKALHTHLQAKTAKDYEPLQMHYAANLVKNIIGNPAKHMDYAKEYAASFILSLVYGRTASAAVNDPEILAIRRSLKRIGTAVRPGAYMVDEYPFLRYLPFYRPELRLWHAEELSLYRNQVAGVKDNMDTVQPCFSKYLLENKTKLRLNDDELVYIAGTMFGAGSATTASAISIVIMAAACFPQMQNWIQDELDVVVGRKRVPTFDDFADLPRVRAFVLESHRWRPVGGSGFAHRASRDIVWRNYCIPKDATVIGNHWSICQDPSVFADPEIFDPIRWLNDDGSLKHGSDALLLNFGFGRRLCPGRHVADRSLFITTALLLWAFRISENDNAPIDRRGFVGEGISITPDAFEVCFERRVEKIEELLGDATRNGTLVACI